MLNGDSNFLDGVENDIIIKNDQIFRKFMVDHKDEIAEDMNSSQGSTQSTLRESRQNPITMYQRLKHELKTDSSGKEFNMAYFLRLYEFEF